MPDGSVWTGFYSDWDQLSKEDRQTVINTRVSNKTKGGRKVAEVGSAKKLKDIRSQVAELKRSLAAIQTVQAVGDNATDDIPENAGDAFGGRQQKKHKKE
jgi:hypothetical protein